MKGNILAGSIIGYKNKEKGKKSQDSMGFIINEDYVIVSVADGHSTDFFKYSKEGASFACQTAINVLQKYYINNIDELKKYLQIGDIQKEIFESWMELVNTHYRVYNNLAYKTEYIRYSTTFIGILLTNKFALCLRIGDGNIILKDTNGYRLVFKNKNNSRVIDSLGRFNSYKFINYKIEHIEAEKLSLLSIFTDGYENSFNDYKKLQNSLDETVKIFNKNIFTRNKIMQSYQEYLAKLSEKKSKDDISIINVIK